MPWCVLWRHSNSHSHPHASGAHKTPGHMRHECERLRLMALCNTECVMAAGADAVGAQTGLE